MVVSEANLANEGGLHAIAATRPPRTPATGDYDM